MDPKVITPNKTEESSGLESELTHATQEMYIKNVELNQRNKTLALLRKIDVIVLSSVTELKQVAQQVAQVVVEEADFKAVIILLKPKSEEVLIPIAVSQTEAVEKIKNELKLKFFDDNILLNQTENTITDVVNSKTKQVSSDLIDILKPFNTLEEAEKIKESVGIISSILYPLVVRGKVIGSMIICLGERVETLSQFQKDLTDRLSGVVGIALDNSLLYEEIEQANEKLRELDKLKDEFVSLASHELRTPMSVIKSYVWALLQGKTGELNEKQKLYLDRTYSTTDRLINLVNDMLNVSRIESGRITVEITKADIGKLINEVVSEMQTRAQEFGITVMYQATSQLPFVKVDLERTKQILINLMGNSLKFTPKDGKITVLTIIENGFVKISITDTGRGMKPDDIGKLFQKFNMVGNTHLTKEKGQGTGLGLYLSKSLIELQGGKIWAESPGEGQGSTFSFTLPVWNGENQATGAAGGVPPVSPTETPTPSK